MIVKSFPIQASKLKGVKLEGQFVTDIDIYNTYKNNEHVSSCMSRPDTVNNTKWYSYVKDLFLFRIIDEKGDVFYRRFLWTLIKQNPSKSKKENKIQIWDECEYTPYTMYHCNTCTVVTNITYPHKFYKDVLSPYGDTPDRCKVKLNEYYAPLLPERTTTNVPYIDTFCFATSDLNGLYCNPPALRLQNQRGEIERLDDYF